jgi:hypothetical protein
VPPDSDRLAVPAIHVVRLSIERATSRPSAP